MFYSFARFLVRVFASLFFRWRVTGTENLPATGPAILAANHASLVDPLFAGSAVHRRVHFMAKEELFRNPLLAPIVRALNAYPVRRGEADRQSLRESLRLLEMGEVLGIFPEGTRSVDGQLHKAKSGIAFLAKRSGAPIVPVAVVGSDRIMRKGHWLPHPARVEVRVGSPIRLMPDDTLSEKEQLQLMSQRVMDAIAELAKNR